MKTLVASLVLLASVSAGVASHPAERATNLSTPRASVASPSVATSVGGARAAARAAPPGIAPSFITTGAAGRATQSVPPVVRPPVRAALETQREVDVLVLVASSPDDVIAALPRESVRVTRVLPGLGAFAARVTSAGADALAQHPAVVGVQLDRRLHPLTAESAVVVHADVVRDGFGVVGRGVVVAALDTGVDATHPDLQDGGVVGQKCFVLGGCPPGNTDEGDLAPEGSGHGTHVTGIITSDGRVAPKGLAPGAGVVMVRVFDDTSYGRESDWAIAMDWVADHAGALGIRVLNLSIGTDNRYPGTCEADWPVMAAAALRVRDAGVVLFAAAGNENEVNALDAPACLPGVVAVGATYDAPLGREPDTGTYTSGCFDADADAGTVMCLSNTSDELDLLAPGSRIRSAAPGGGVAEKRGTSEAAPHASAAAALMLEVDPALTPDDIERILKETGRPTVDPKAPGRTTPFLDVEAAVESTRASFCSRHADGTACVLAFATCDGGACEGACRSRACSGDAPRVVPALHAEWPGAPVGCSTVGAGSVLALLALVRLLRRRR